VSCSRLKEFHDCQNARCRVDCIIRTKASGDRVLRSILMSVFPVIIFVISNCATTSHLSFRNQVVGSCVRFVEVQKRIPSASVVTKSNPLFPEKRPQLVKCQRVAIEAALKSVKINIQGMNAGAPASGSKVVAAITRQQMCDDKTRFCQPIPLPASEFEYYLSDEIKDPCIRYCAGLHEWEHFIDSRAWNMDWPDDKLAIFMELPAYEKQAKCLSNFLVTPHQPNF
jgi:hypothetical protein